MTRTPRIFLAAIVLLLVGCGSSGADSPKQTKSYGGTGSALAIIVRCVEGNMLAETDDGRTSIVILPDPLERCTGRDDQAPA